MSDCLTAAQLLHTIKLSKTSSRGEFTRVDGSLVYENNSHTHVAVDIFLILQTSEIPSAGLTSLQASLRLKNKIIILDMECY